MSLPLVQAESFSFTWEGAGERALDRLSFQISPGEIFLCTGGSGAGKSTLALALSGLIPHRTGGRLGGKLLLKGKDSRECSPLELSRDFGISFQQPQEQFFSLSLEEEVAFSLEQRGLPPAEIRQRVEESLHFTGLQGFETARPQDLSGGEMQRASLAILLAFSPSLYILDEPLAALDPQGRKEILQLLLKIREREKAAFILFTKDPLPFLPVSDKAMLLDRGQILTLGDSGDWSPFLKSLEQSSCHLSQLFQLGELLRKPLSLGEPFLEREKAEISLFGGLE